MNHPGISLIIPAYNAERYLGEAIDSVLAQGHPRVEIVVVDDGSTDDTPQIIAGYGQRLRVVTQANRGVSAARNVGVEASGGELLCFLDADDKLRPSKILRQVAQLKADASLDLCDCHMQGFWSPEVPDEDREADPRSDQPHWWRAAAGALPCWLFRRSLWDRVGPFDTDRWFGEDTDWFARACDAGMRRHTLPEVLVDRRLHGDNTTLRITEHAQRDAIAGVMRAHLLRKRRKEEV